MKINVMSVMVDDQAKALRFYTEVLGFVKKNEIPLGEHPWLTVVSPEDPDGTELSLEPDEHPAARPFKQALVEDGIPFTSFAVDDVAAEYERLVARGVRFTQPPTDMGPGDDRGVRRHVRQPHPDRRRERVNRAPGRSVHVVGVRGHQAVPAISHRRALLTPPPSPSWLLRARRPSRPRCASRRRPRGAASARRRAR